MPVYENTQPPYSVCFGFGSNVVNKEQLGTNNFSERVAIADRADSQMKPVLVTFTYATVPSSVQYDIYVARADDGPFLSYTKIGSTTNVNGDQVTLNRAAAGGNSFRFICVREVVSPGVNATVGIHM